jgi:two-component system sensor kinase FixL
MSWVTVIWSMIAAACLTLAAIHLLIWWQRRAVGANLLFSLTATAVAAYAVIELRLLHAETPAEFATALRWLHVPTWVLTVSLVGFVRLHLRAGRLWLAWTFFALRTVALLLNFGVGQNLNYREVTGLRHIPFLGESASLAEGVANPWMLVGQLSLLLLLIFTADAALTVWRRGDRRQALVTGGSIVFFTLVSVFQSVLVLWRLVDLPLTASFFFLGIVVAMGYELSRETLRAAQLSDDLRVSDERVALAAEAAQFGVWGRDLAQDEIWGSAKWRRLFGFADDEKINFEKFLQRIHPDDRAMVQRAVKRAQEDRGEYMVDYRLILPDGTERWIASRGRVAAKTNGKPDQILGASVDITVRKQSELEIGRQRNELAHLSRVATVSELSGSLAHELNQPLAIILTNAQAAQRLLAQQPPDLAEARDILADIISEDQRAGEVIRRLRAMLKHGETSLQPVAANEIIEEVLQFTRNDLIRQSVTVQRNLAANLPAVLGDRIHLQQVLINLILNACDAMAATPPADRQMVLTTSLHESAVRISVSDNGGGLPAEVEQIFQPFYTTKKEGLGLGLSICRSIVQAHQGRLWAEARSSVAGGSTLHLDLPAAAETTP